MFSNKEPNIHKTTTHNNQNNFKNNPSIVSFWSNTFHSFYYSAKSLFFRHLDSSMPASSSLPVLLSQSYPSCTDPQFLLDLYSRPWITYRSGFPPIHPSHYTSDVGWGCMLRSGQMLLCNAFFLLELGRDWRLDTLKEQEMYVQASTF